MRSADIVTILRLPLLLILIYAIFLRLNWVFVLFLIALLFVSDAFDGYLAAPGKHSMSDYFAYLFEEASGRRNLKRRPPQNVPGYAANLDITIDRIIEYAFWITFTYLGILPLFVVLIILIRNAITDFLMFRRKKTFSKMKSWFGRIASSHFSRGAYAALKAINFAYLSLVAVANWPLVPGYLLSGIVVIYSLLRGAAEVYESIS